MDSRTRGSGSERLLHHGCQALRLLPKNRRYILCSANNGVSVVMYRPILAAAEPDPRLRFFHTARLSHTRKIDAADHSDPRAFFRRQGIDRGVLPSRIARALPFDVYLSPNFSNRLFARRARLKVQIFHGVSFKNCGVHAEKTERFDRLFVPGPYHRRRFIEQGILKSGDPRIRMVGLPKLDRLSNGSLDRVAILRALDLDPALPVVLYAPTGDPGNSLNRQGEAILNALLDLPIQLIVKPHDHAGRDADCNIDWRARLTDWKHERLRADLGSDVVPLLFAADLLITDASSVAFEYTILDRPIVFMDVPEILAGQRRKNIDLDTWGRNGGEIVQKAEALREVVPRLLENPGDKGEIRRAIARDLFHRPGDAAERALRTLYDDLELDPPGALRDVAPAPVG